MANMPKYIEIYRKIKEDIRNEVYQVNDFLPNEGDLEKKYDVSRTTVRNAVEMLKKEGIVDVTQGRGTQVSRRQTSRIGNQFLSFAESLEKQGGTVANRDMSIRIMEADSRLSNDLEISAGDKVAMVQMIQIADDEPIAIAAHYMPYRFVPEIEKYEGAFSDLYRFIRETYNIFVGKTYDCITSSNSTFLEAQTLNIKPGDALMNIRRICYSKEIPVSVDILNIIGSKYILELATGDVS